MFLICVQVLILATFAPYTWAKDIVLQDIAPLSAQRAWNARADLNEHVLSLLDSDIFLWGDSATGTFGNLTVFTPKDDEHIISLDRFKPLIASSVCLDTSITISFKDTTAFAAAKKQWEWVNNAESHSFILVVGTGDCGWNTQRQPFLVTSFKYDESNQSLHLDAAPRNWQEIIHTYKLNVGTLHNSSVISSPAKRYHSESPIPFDWLLRSNQLKIDLDQGETILFDCDPCGTEGSFLFNIDLDVEYFIPVRADLSLFTSRVSATITPKFSFSISLSEKKELWKKEFGPFPIDAILIPGILTLGPEIIPAITIDFSGLKVVGTMSASITAKVQDGSSISFDLLPYLWTAGLLPPIPSAEGWDTSLSTTPVKVSAEITGTVKATLDASVVLAAKILGYGITAGISVGPFAQEKLTTVISSTAVCPEDPYRHTTGVKVDGKYGFEVRAKVSQTGISNEPVLDFRLFNASRPFPGKVCFGISGTAPIPVNPSGSPAATCSNTIDDPSNCGSCGYFCSPREDCVDSTCKAPPDPNTPATFSPKIQPGAGTSPEGGWGFTADAWQYVQNEISLALEDHVIFEGRRTVNTECMSVLLTGANSILPGDHSVIPAKSNLVFETRKEPNPDYCCVAFFQDYGCKLVPGQYRTNCAGFQGPSPIDIRSWQIYNCTGRYHVFGQPDPGCVGNCS
ncbi:hypothetical protein BCR34DRAFT_593078 [Clohesyomyces aquaticus]|uniref:Uncharacterized protein n=1 Tax=Clohesyomyces aquaticus TaxID=1231657 RepID=A0A1Y1YML2_9PLEO|nr:hypothetical protein BCR34DRAFT_593078 [Clohesyomyces aquaticus]